MPITGTSRLRARIALNLAIPHVHGFRWYPAMQSIIRSLGSRADASGPRERRIRTRETPAPAEPYRGDGAAILLHGRRLLSRIRLGRASGEPRRLLPAGDRLDRVR